MKRKLLYFSAMALMVLAFASCQKEKPMECFDEENKDDLYITPESFDEGISLAWDELQILGGTDQEGLSFENEGILPFLEEEPFGDEIAGNRNRRNPCQLNGNLRLDPRQVLGMRNAWRDYDTCHKHSARQLRTQHARLKHQFEERRVKLVQAFRANRITEREFRAGMERLRNEFRMEMNKQGAQHRHAIQRCYVAYLGQVKQILTPEQFRVFMRCHRGKLPMRR